MDVRVTFHLDSAESGGKHEFVWWAESADVVGFTAAAPTLTALRRLVIETLTDHLDAAPVLVEHVAPVERLLSAQVAVVTIREPLKAEHGQVNVSTMTVAA